MGRSPSLFPLPPTLAAAAKTPARPQRPLFALAGMLFAAAGLGPPPAQRRFLPSRPSRRRRLGTSGPSTQPRPHGATSLPPALSSARPACSHLRLPQARPCAAPGRACLPLRLGRPLHLLHALPPAALPVRGSTRTSSSPGAAQTSAVILNGTLLCRFCSHMLSLHGLLSDMLNLHGLCSSKCIDHIIF